jgi:hypothetical protein
MHVDPVETEAGRRGVEVETKKITRKWRVLAAPSTKKHMRTGHLLVLWHFWAFRISVAPLAGGWRQELSGKMRERGEKKPQYLIKANSTSQTGNSTCTHGASAAGLQPSNIANTSTYLLISCVLRSFCFYILFYVAPS